jgi:hypothetical protein
MKVVVTSIQHHHSYQIPSKCQHFNGNPIGCNKDALGPRSHHGIQPRLCCSPYRHRTITHQLMLCLLLIRLMNYYSNGIGNSEGRKTNIMKKTMWKFLLVGTEGSGKTTLLDDIAFKARSKGIQVLRPALPLDVLGTTIGRSYGG